MLALAIRCLCFILLVVEKRSESAKCILVFSVRESQAAGVGVPVRFKTYLAWRDGNEEISTSNFL